jgi:hypothetical protein
MDTNEGSIMDFLGQRTKWKQLFLPFGLTLEKQSKYDCGADNKFLVYTWSCIRLGGHIVTLYVIV